MAAHWPAQHCAGPRQSAACSCQSRQRGDAGVRELATAPPACRLARGRAGRPPRRAPEPLDTPFLPHRLSLAFLHHGRRSRCHLAGVAAPTVDLAPYHRVLQHRRRPLLRASRAPSARLPRSSATDLTFAAHRRRSPPPSPLQQLASDLAVRSVATTVSLATFLSSPFSLSSSVATARSSPARVAVELVADEAPAIQRSHHHGR